MTKTKPYKPNFPRPDSWRYLPPLAAAGAEQMAIDLWLLAQHYQGRSGPVLRCYTWEPAAISLGYHQRYYPEAWNQLRWRGQPVDLVRRPTGGRAVVHDGDLTYLLAHAHLPGSRQQVYEQLCEILIQGWRSLGYELHYGTAGGHYARQPNCFALATAADLVTAAGLKVIGSAQRRWGAAVLQHGSIRLGTGHGLYEQAFGQPEPPRLAIAPDQAIQALRQACQACWGAAAVEQPLEAAEWRAVRAIAAQIRAGQLPTLGAILDRV